MTYDEAGKNSDPDASVPCTDAHTSVTTKVITFASTPDWSSDALLKQVSANCSRAMFAFFDGATRAVELSTYSIFFFPTKAQRDAGALWARCDVALYGKNDLKPLPTDGKSADYVVVGCDHAHRYQATVAVKHRGSAYPGLHKIVSWTVEQCRARLGRSFGYYASPTAYLWREGYRYSLCYKTTRS